MNRNYECLSPVILTVKHKNNSTPTPPSLDVEKLVVAIYDFVAEAEDMISMKEGDTFVVVEEDHNGWTVVKKRNGTEEGFVPTEYIDNV